MNDRIRQFEKQCWNHQTNHLDTEKFAELLIRECMELTHWKDFEMSSEQRIRLSVYQDIKEHFGVEE